MKKSHPNKRFAIHRETLASLDRLDGALLAKVAAGASHPCTGTSSCTRPLCTCF